VKRKKLDCNIHQEKKKGLSLGFKVNVAYLVTAGPEISFTEETKMHWNDSCQELIRRYEELCDEHNQGNLTLAEFERRRKELDNYYERMIKLKQEIQDRVEKGADRAFEELDQESQKRAKAEALGKEIKELSSKVDQLAKELKELKEKKPESQEGASGKTQAQPAGSGAQAEGKGDGK
jgi:uncharacterized coiled-coil DUF342 family protein